MKIIKTIDATLVDTSEFDNVPEYDGVIENEVKPLTNYKCFLGAWYHKVVSSKDEWLGIEGELELGEFIPDEDRFNLDGKMRYMDNHNVYMGGNALFETDCGLGYNTMYESTDTSKPLTLSSKKLGYRPFYRFICKERIENGGNVDVINSNFWRVSDEKCFGNYYFPGDVIRMKVYSPKPNYLQLRIEVIKPTAIEKYVEIRKKYQLPNNLPTDYISPLFYSEGQGLVKAEFKRVNSIDQYGNEGSNAFKTKAVVKNEIWHNCYLYRRINNQLVKVPFNKSRQTIATCPDKKCVILEDYNTSAGGEKINFKREKSE